MADIKRCSFYFCDKEEETRVCVCVCGWQGVAGYPCGFNYCSIVAPALVVASARLWCGFDPTWLLDVGLKWPIDADITLLPTFLIREGCLKMKAAVYVYMCVCVCVCVCLSCSLNGNSVKAVRETLLGKQLVSWKFRGNERDVFECKYVCKYEPGCARSESRSDLWNGDMKRGGAWRKQTAVSRGNGAAEGKGRRMWMGGWILGLPTQPPDHFSTLQMEFSVMRQCCFVVTVLMKAFQSHHKEKKTHTWIDCHFSRRLDRTQPDRSHGSPVSSQSSPG